VSEHYYTQKPSVGHDRRIVEETLRGRKWKFVTDAGVFSKGSIDFGSKLLIETMHIPQTANVLDVGCGYGPMGLSAAVLAQQGLVTMVDINERAIELAKENAALNGITNVQFLQSDLLAALNGKSFTHILTNPPIRAGKHVVHRLFEEAYDHLLGNGELWIVIQKKQGAPSAIAKLEECFNKVIVVEKDKGYYIICAKKIS
jgi:16S rRNA (guanine1207-N2)-methyltransferase